MSLRSNEPPPAYATIDPRITDLQQDNNTTRNCLICSSTFPIDKTVRLPCGHRFCPPCFIDAFTFATKKEGNFPAQCCNMPFSLTDARPHLGERLANLYAEKRAEYNTEANRRVYCYKCEAFIREGRVERNRDVAVCEKCGERTCVKCKRKYHGSDSYPTDKELQKTLKLIKEKGWKKCPKCGRVLERVKGTCNTIMCYCGTTWCYKCGKKGRMLRNPLFEDEPTTECNCKDPAPNFRGGGNQECRHFKYAPRNENLGRKCMRCKNTATTFCLGCGRQAFCDLCQALTSGGREVTGCGPRGQLPVGYRDRNGSGRAGPLENFLGPEHLVGRGGFPGRNPRDFEFGTRGGFGDRMHRGYDGRMPEDFVGRAPSGFEGEVLIPKEEDPNKTMMLRDHRGGKKCPRCGTISDGPDWIVPKVWCDCGIWYCYHCGKGVNRDYKGMGWCECRLELPERGRVMHCQHPKMSVLGRCDPGRNCSIRECHENATSFCDKCGEAACDLHEKMMSSGMMEGMIHRTNEGYFKTGRGLTEGPMMVQLAQEEMKKEKEERRRRKRR